MPDPVILQVADDQIKGAEYECNGVLRNYKLDFVATSKRWHGGLATIKEKCGSVVHGCVWRVPEELAEELDRQEAGYHRLTVPIECSDCMIECRTYQYSDKKARSEPPSPHYKTVILAGAVENSLPSSYIKGLAAFPDNGYKGRVEVDIEVIKHLNEA
ncbi:hypothetical protein ANCCEY_09989 [Ancylostoma ceylanicum]|uniref:gamma-glutamylcyclotransferase n=1 Tax=Ancylostoma ceylanicum TaxID=53326 RepID=A0A0D6LG19_9BILA|nr:hypothetical protein ANCCEY_09989 [Ancylostoma ceylanicum]